MKRTISIFMLLMLSGMVYAEKFEFQYRDGEKYRILSEVDEMVYIDGYFVQRVNILNKIAVEVAEIRNGSGFLNAVFQVSEREWGTDTAYQLTDEYESEYWRDNRGFTEIEPQYFMPVVRNVPVFPERSLSVGDTWTAAGEEVHDFTNLGITDAFHFPIDVNYEYTGKGELDGKEYEIITVQYNVFYKPPRIYNAPDYYPVQISGYSDQVVYWDTDAGRPYAYEEEFDLIFDFAYGGSFEALGTAQAKVVESDYMDREKLIEDIQDEIDEQGIEDTDVRETEEGITLSLSNIQFLPDSAVLIQSEKDKLDKIGDILKKYADRDILIVGHTALAGTYESRLSLSIERAQVVGDFLLSLGVRDQSQMIIKGVGATQPVADNDTEENMKKNRRVEITILEN